MKHQLNWIQALRGFAALMVLFFHMRPHWELTPTLAAFSEITRWGFSGVDIFFALSGFVVYRSARHAVPEQGIALFVKRRLLRIYLGYWPVLLLIALTTVFVYHSDLPPIRKMVFSTLLLYPNIWDNWLLPAWSLTMEIYFYLWIAAIAMLPQRHQVKAIVCGATLLAAWGLGWLVADRSVVFAGQQPLRYALTGLGIEFLAGALVAHVYETKPQSLHRPYLAIAVCLGLMAAGVALGMTSPYFDRVEVMRAGSFGVMGVAAVVAALALEQTRHTPPAWLVTLGDASFSLYLLHTFLLDLSGNLRMYFGITSTEALLAFLLALPVVIAMVSRLWYVLVEKPIMKAVL